jgi:hypothetical protein
MLRKSFSCLVLLLTFPAPAYASAIMKMSEEFYGKETRTCSMVIAVDPKRARVDSDCGPKKVTLITLHDSKTILMLDLDNKSYFEMSQQTLEKLQSNPMEALKSDPRYAAQLAKLTPEQKAMMEKMMTGAMKKMNEVKTELKKIGKQKKVGAWSCTTYGIYMNGNLAEDLCIADPSQFPALAPVMTSWKNFLSGWLKAGHSPTFKVHEEAAKLGISVETLVYSSGELKSRSDLVEVKSEDRPDSFFSAPSDFKKASSPLMH